MAELGQLSSSTDPKLIASTLMALKDIVALEAAESDTSFMTGNVENSNYGVFSFTVNEQLKLIMSYIVSTDKGRAVDQKFVYLIEDLIRNFGMQLTQFGEIAELAQSGAVLPRGILIQAYLNACTIIRTERKLDSRPRHLNEGYKRVIDQVIKDNETKTLIVEEVLGNDLFKNNELWQENGILKDSYVSRLYKGFADYVVYSVANQQPDLFLYSPNPRAEQQQVLERVRKVIPGKVNKTTEKLIELLPGVMNKAVEKYIKRIALVDLHKAERQLQLEFVRRTYKKLIKQDALHLYKHPVEELITNRFNELVPKLEIETAADFIFKGIKDEIPLFGQKFVKAYLDGFIEGLGDTSLSPTAMDLMIAFAQSFLDSKELANKIKEIDGIEKRWVRDLTRFTKSKTINNLQVDSMETAVLLSNAAGKAIVNALTKILIENFFIINDQVGQVIKDIVFFYNYRGKSIKIGSILFGFMELLKSLPYEMMFLVPTYKDIIFSNIIANKMKIRIGEQDFSYQSKNRAFISGDEYRDLYDIINTEESLILAKNNININLSQISLDYIIALMNDGRNIFRAVGFAMRRRVQTEILVEFRDWRSKISKQMNSILRVLPKLSRQKLSGFDLIPPSYAGFSSRQFGDEVYDLLVETAEICSREVNKQNDELILVKKEANQKGEVPKKADKIIEKIINQLEKNLQKYEDQLSTELEKVVVQIEKEVMGLISGYSKLIQPDYDILKYNYSSNEFLPNISMIKPDLDKFIDKTEGIEPEDINQLILSITLSLYDNPPDSVFENVYSEILSGKPSKSLKKTLSKIRTRQELERQLKSGGEALSNQLYMDLTDLINLIDTYFVDKDGIVSSDNGNLYLKFGRLRISEFPQTTIITELMKLNGISAIRETSEWLVALNFTSDYDFAYEDPSIVTFSDAIRFITRKRFESNTEATFDGLAKVASMMETNAGQRVNLVYEQLKNIIFDTSMG